MSAIVERLKQKIDEANFLHTAIYTELHTFREKIPEMSMEDAADTGYVLRKVAELFDDLRKELNKTEKIFAAIAGKHWLARYGNHRKPPPIRSELCSATPRFEQVAFLPSVKRNEEDYLKLANWLGIEKDKIDITVIHWKNLMNLLTERAKKGLPLPPGIDPSKTHLEFNMTYRGKKDIIDEN